MNAAISVQLSSLMNSNGGHRIEVELMQLRLILIQQVRFSSDTTGDNVENLF